MSLKGPIVSVEDDEDDQYLIEQSIRRLSIPNEVRFFANGQEALHYLEQTDEKPLLILSDVNMPIMDGLEFRHHINRSDFLRKKSIPFVFLTTASNPTLIQAAYDAAVQGFYKKANNYAGMHQQIRLIIEYWQSCLHPNSDLL